MKQQNLTQRHGGTEMCQCSDLPASVPLCHCVSIRVCLAIIASFALTTSAVADEPALESITIGQPTRIELFPPAVRLAGPRSRMQLVVTGHYADGQMQDLTRTAQFATTNPAVAAIDGSVAVPKQDGSAEIVVVAGGLAAKATVEVTGFAAAQPISFEWETLAALSKQGCNSGACHGSPSGKGGFRLSLRAFDSALDKLTLIREDLGRRTNALNPDESLLLNKPLMKVPHGGGQKLKKGEAAYDLLRAGGGAVTAVRNEEIVYVRALALAEAGLPEAEERFAEAAAILRAKADSLEDPALRDSLLERVRLSREILASARTA